MPMRDCRGSSAAAVVGSALGFSVAGAGETGEDVGTFFFVGLAAMDESRLAISLLVASACRWIAWERGRPRQ